MCAQQVKYNKNHLTRGVIGQATCWIYKFCVNMQYFMCQICFDSTQYFWFIIITFCWFAGFLFCCHFVACGQIISWPFSSFFFFCFLLLSAFRLSLKCSVSTCVWFCFKDLHNTSSHLLDVWHISSSALAAAAASSLF